MNNTDCHFEIGSTHDVCEDYALALEERCFLSDGCSTGEHTDVGARLLCHVASGLPVHTPPERVVYEVNAARRVLLLPEACTRATLFSGYCTDHGFHIQATGDGTIVGIQHSGQVRIEDIQYPSGAPLYPAYLAKEADLEAYRDEFGLRRVIECTEMHSGEVRDSYEENEPVPRKRYFSYDLYHTVLLLSDGASTFVRRNPETGVKDPVPLVEVVSELVKIKNFKGEFIKRRAKRFLKTSANNGWEHYDDFSVGALHHEEEQDA